MSATPTTAPSPAYRQPLYPWRAVGAPLDNTRLADASYIRQHDALYELTCPNPACELVIRASGSRLHSLHDKLIRITGCPACKLQFGPDDNSGFSLKKGERPRDIPRNGGRWNGFIVRRVIYIPPEVFADYALRLFGKSAEQLTREEADAIGEAFYREGDWQAVHDRQLAALRQADAARRQPHTHAV